MVEEKHRLHIAPVPPGRPTAQMRCSRKFPGDGSVAVVLEIFFTAAKQVLQIKRRKRVLRDPVIAVGVPGVLPDSSSSLTAGTKSYVWELFQPFETGNEQGYRSGSSARGLFTSCRCNFLVKAIDLLEAPQAIVLMTQPGTHNRSNKATALRCFNSTSIQRNGWYCFGSQHFDQMTTTKR